MADGYAQRANEPELIITADDLPADAPIEVVRPRHKGERTIAHLATNNGEVLTDGGETLHYSAGEHYIVEHRTGGKSVVRKDIFEKMYRPSRGGLFKKRHNLRLRASVADTDMQISTLEGVKTAHRGDWIMIGVADELWPVPEHEARLKYKRASIIGWTGVGTTVLMVFLLLFVTLIATPR